MPELPEVETVRDGLDRWVTGRIITSVDVGNPRAVRRHVAGPEDLVGRLVGRRVVAVSRRGKYLWLPLADPGPPDERRSIPDDCFSIPTSASPPPTSASPPPTSASPPPTSASLATWA